ncbi:MAG: NifB/NifX family molybdenum-iron cluster-binding protein [Candidatus Omnitrophica bacterium]|nr:NifB/NifX family molybdenum-iron cluster-binding protein [Candidatus Omnitrophota bacterium]
MIKNKSTLYIIILALVVAALGVKFITEKAQPITMSGKSARYIAIPSTGKDINSPVSYLCGRAPYFIICDRATGTYKAILNKYTDAQHASGLKSGQMLVSKKIDALCANNVGFEPMRVLHNANIEVYTNIKGTVWQTLNAYPNSLTKIEKQTVPSHFGITGSKTPIACNSFDITANLGDIVQGKYYICGACQFRISAASTGGTVPVNCPNCGGLLQEVITVNPINQKGGVKPKVRVY